MSEDHPLSQDEIDALLKTPAGAGDQADGQVRDPRVRPYDPAAQHRVIRERLHTLDIINERFARNFRVSLFNLLRRSADITVSSVNYQSYQDFAQSVSVPTNINLISMKPLRGTALIEFPPSLVFLVVDNLFGGDGRFVPEKHEGRDFTNTEQRIIQRLLDIALSAYGRAWQSVYPLELSHVRSESQAKFANITNSPREIIVNSSFHLDVGNMSSEYRICIPYSMIEPLRDMLTNPSTDTQDNDHTWNQRMATGIHHSEVELVADFVNIPCRIAQVLSLKLGDVLPVELPETITARVDGVPVIECEYGTHGDQRALRVSRTIDHNPAPVRPASLVAEGTTPLPEEHDHE